MIVTAPVSISGFSTKELKIVSLIVVRQIIAMKKWRQGEFYYHGKPKSMWHEYVQVCRNELNRMIGGKYSKIIESLREKRVIQRNDAGGYSTGNATTKARCYQYRLHPDRWNEPLTLVAMPQRKQQRVIDRRFHKVRENLREQYVAGEQFLSCFLLPDEHVNEYERFCTEHEWPDWQRVAIARFNQKRWWSNVDIYGRYHSPLTNLHKPIRAFICCNGSEVVGFDMANFQPALLTQYESIGIELDMPTKERQHYYELCEAGEIYKFMLENTEYQDVADVKKKFCAMLFKTNKAMRKMKLWQAFDHFFPTYSQVIQKIKRHNYKRMPKFLQRLEADIIFGRCLKNFQKISSAPFFTVHDAIYTDENVGDQLNESMRTAISSLKIPTQIREERRIQHTTQHQAYICADELNLRLSL